MDKRVRLREFQEDDREFMVHWLDQKHVQRWLLHPDHWLQEIDQRHKQEPAAQAIIVEPDLENIPSQKVLLANEFLYNSEKGYYQKIL